eukprot:scaffold324144_cov54-Tisochrysis_lutea.AAC.1
MDKVREVRGNTIFDEASYCGIVCFFRLYIDVPQYRVICDGIFYLLIAIGIACAHRVPPQDETHVEHTEQ